MILDEMCAKPWSGLIISQIKKQVDGFFLYPPNDPDHYNLVALHKLYVI